MAIGVCIYCKKEKKINGKGYCNWCYRKHMWKQKLIICSRCKRELPHHAKGLCAGCYQSTFQLDKIKAWNHQKNHNISVEKYKELTKECLICGFNKYVVLHHLDENHSNSDDKNLIGLCPNHHQMIHTLQYKEEVLSLIREKLEEKSLLPTATTKQEINVEQLPQITLKAQKPLTDRPIALTISKRILVGECLQN